MPELPDITIYIEALERFVVQKPIEGIELRSPFLLRSVVPSIQEAKGRRVIFEAHLSPITWTSRLTEEQIEQLFEATRFVLTSWIDRLREETGERFPERVTAFRKQMCVHGRFGKRCSTCGTVIQRVVYSSNETNYCPRCQTGGKVLADRSLSRLLKKD